MSNYSYTTRYTRDEKKEILSKIILEAWTEQFTDAREPSRKGEDPFDIRAFRTASIDRLVDVLRSTEALELLAEMVGVIHEEENDA